MEGDTEPWLFRPGTVIREVQALLEDCVDVRRTKLAVLFVIVDDFKRIADLSEIVVAG